MQINSISSAIMKINDQVKYLIIYLTGTKQEVDRDLDIGWDSKKKELISQFLTGTHTVTYDIIRTKYDEIRFSDLVVKLSPNLDFLFKWYYS